MSARSFHQYFGPSPRHDRACIEMRFRDDGKSHRLDTFEEPLARFGLSPGEDLPDAPLLLAPAVCRLARAMLSHARWWSASGSESGHGWAALSHPFPEAAGLALDGALALLRSGGNPPPDAAARLRRLSDWIANAMRTGMRLRASADVLGLETAQLNPATILYQIGFGAKGLHFDQAANERDTSTGALLDRNKHATAVMLTRFGLPATRGVLVQNAQQAIEAIKHVGLPCVVKPVAMNKGAGVATLLQTEAEVLAALAHVQTLSRRPVRIENHVAGDDHRIMVCGDEVLWAYRRMPATVTGDGKATIRELVERENRRRESLREGSDAYLYHIDIDDAMQRLLDGRYGLGLDSVLAADRRIDVAGQANIARGGTIEDLTEVMHPDNRALALRVSRLIRTRTMGLDFLTPDISRSWKDGPCAIVEVNGGPATWGMGDTSAVVRALFPNRLSGRIPTIVVVGRTEFRARAEEAARAALAKAALRLATAPYTFDDLPDPARVTGSLLAPAVETLMLDAEADAALVACAPEAVERAGLPLRRCDLLVVEDGAPPPWLTAPAETVLRGALAPAKIDSAVAKLARRYADPAEGGPRPVLELAESAANEFRVTVWRCRAMPLDWFWRQVGLAPPRAEGMTTHEDLLAAVRALAVKKLGGTARLRGAFTHGELIGSWFRMTFEAALPLPKAEPDAARAALLAAVERVNEIVATPIDPLL